MLVSMDLYVNLDESVCIYVGLDLYVHLDESVCMYVGLDYGFVCKSR